MQKPPADTGTEATSAKPKSPTVEMRHAVDIEATIAIDELLDDPVPEDWNDPAAVRARWDNLAAVARAVGEAMVELVVRAQELRQRGLSLTQGDPFVTTWADALIALHRAIFRYNHDVPQAGCDGLERALRTIEQEFGAGIATIVMGLLERLWSEFDQFSHKRIMASMADLDREDVNFRRRAAPHRR